MIYILYISPLATFDHGQSNSLNYTDADNNGKAALAHLLFVLPRSWYVYCESFSLQIVFYPWTVYEVPVVHFP